MDDLPSSGMENLTTFLRISSSEGACEGVFGRTTLPERCGVELVFDTAVGGECVRSPLKLVSEMGDRPFCSAGPLCAYGCAFAAAEAGGGRDGDGLLLVMPAPEPE